jgi:hypothetical protein
MITKICPKCKEEKSVDSYYKDTSKRSGISSYCKTCYNQYRKNRDERDSEFYKKRYELNRDSILQKLKQVRMKNPEKQREASKRWRKNNPELAKQRRREYYWNNVDKERDRGKLYNKLNPEKSRESRRRWEKNNPEKVKEHKRKYQKKKSYKRKMFSIEYKGGKCEDCGIIATMENRSIFDFHHLNPSNKKDDINEIQTKNIDRLKEELDKCVLLCANCHRLRHQNYQDGLSPTL